MSKSIRTIHPDDFGISNQSERWTWVAFASWCHQVRGVKGVHRHIIFGAIPKEQQREEPSLELIIAKLNAEGPHRWQVAP